jgi:hypothetical protein
MDVIPKPEPPQAPPERLAYSVQESADLLGVNYFSVYRLIQRGNRSLKKQDRILFTCDI